MRKNLQVTKQSWGALRELRRSGGAVSEAAESGLPPALGMGALLRLVGRAQLSVSPVAVCVTAASLAFGFLTCKEKRHKFGVPQDFPLGRKRFLG